MEKENLIKKACYFIDIIETVLPAVETDKPAESLPIYCYKPGYVPAEDILARVKNALGKPEFTELAFEEMEKHHKIEDIMLNTSFDKYGRDTDWFQHNNYDIIVSDFPEIFVNLYSMTKAK